MDCFVSVRERETFQKQSFDHVGVVQDTCGCCYEIYDTASEGDCGGLVKEHGGKKARIAYDLHRYAPLWTSVESVVDSIRCPNTINPISASCSPRRSRTTILDLSLHTGRFGTRAQCEVNMNSKIGIPATSWF